jgi:hypothetical protein
MPQSITADTTVEQFVLEHAKALALELEAAAANAPDGQVIHSLEGLLLDRGRDFLKKVMAFTAQHQAEQVEKRGRRPGPVAVVSPAATRAARR